MTNIPVRQGDLGADEEKGKSRGNLGQLPEWEKEERGKKHQLDKKRKKGVEQDKRRVQK